jgi:hypothetical protein
VRTFALWTVVLVGTLAMAQQHCRKVDRDPSTGFCVVPDHKLTPGLMDARHSFVNRIRIGLAT